MRRGTGTLTETHIEATRERVWRILLDFETYPEWNPLIRRVSGRPQVGQRLKVRVAQPGFPAFTFQPLVTGVDRPRELRWVIEVPTASALVVRHRFRLDPSDDGTATRFRQHEDFTGPLKLAVPAVLRERLAEGFRTMDRALKHRAEGQSSDGDD